MQDDYAHAFGRAGEALARWERRGEAVTQAVHDCDLCGAALQDYDLVPQTIQWRTREQTQSVQKFNLPMVQIQKKTVTWYQRSGLYFLCENCRQRIRPPLARAVPYGLAAAAISFPISYVMFSSVATWIVLLGVAVGFGLGLAFGMRSQYKGFPADSGFHVHETTFDGRDRPMAMQIAILVCLVLPLLGSLFSGGGRDIDRELILADRAENIPDRMGQIRRNLDELDKLAPENRQQIGEWLLMSWNVNQPDIKKRYPTIPAFEEAVRKSLGKSDTKTTIERVAAGKEPQ